MDKRKYLTCLWPGLSELWWRGRLSALPLAIGFSLGLNGLLILRYLYPGWLSPLIVHSAFWIGLIAWVCWTLKSIRELPELLEPRRVSDKPDQFAEAQAAYLQGNWSAAETSLLGTLSVEPRDPPALLLLSGVYRHTGRIESAAALVQELGRLEVADPWSIELQSEAARIERDRVAAEAVEESADRPAEPAADLTAA